MVTIHDLVPYRHPELDPWKFVVYLRASLRQAAACADRIISVSHATARELTSILGVDPARIAVCGSSMGGYYAARAACYEPRLAAAISHGAIWSVHDMWGNKGDDFGLAIAPAGDESGAVVVTGVDPTSAAAEAGLRRGDLITEVNGREVQSVPEFIAAIRSLKSSDYARMYVFRPQFDRGSYVVVEVP